MKKILFLAAAMSILAGAFARADELFMISDAQGVATFTSGDYDISGYSVASIEVCGVGGVATGTISIQWRNTSSDDYKEIGSFSNPGTDNLCQGMYGPGTGLLRAVLNYGAGTFRVTLRRTK